MTRKTKRTSRKYLLAGNATTLCEILLEEREREKAKEKSETLPRIPLVSWLLKHLYIQNRDECENTPCDYHRKHVTFCSNIFPLFVPLASSCFGPSQQFLLFRSNWVLMGSLLSTPSTLVEICPKFIKLLNNSFFFFYLVNTFSHISF